MGLSRLMVGAHALCHINGRLFGRVADISVESDSPHREVHCVDTLEPAELVAQALRGGGQMAIYRIHGDGGIQATGMIPAWRDVTRAKYFSILITDRFSDTVFFRADACSVLKESWRVGRGYVMGSVAFKILSWGNEVQPSSG